jgi:peroxiredoxin
MVLKSLLGLATLLPLVGCHRNVEPSAPAPDIGLSETRPGTDGKEHALVSATAPFTVLEFFSNHCPCQAQHDARLREIALAYGPRGVAFFAVDSESDAALERDQAEAERRGYPYPILVDPHGALARRLDAAYATYTVVLDRQGHVIYAGGIDSDKSHLTDGATPHLRDALDDALLGVPQRNPHPTALGCALMLE